MIIVKFIVLFGCISVLSALQTNYCNICLNHTLCQYKLPGPSAACHLYNNTALLTSKEIEDLVYKINERRNFVAMGHSTILPQAANMNKVHWSNELAKFAQRWADQCDPLLHPDREDDCRDLENAKVGQNIASVIGASPGLNIKSFIEVWFMQILDYVGTVTYYNQSRDYMSNYFTQLIWAETEFVGCGKVKFYAQKRKMIMVRLVCNFAPKGNIEGKPVYAVGYARTQCKNNVKVIPDHKFQGLCSYDDSGISKKSIERHPVNSLLKVLNLSNDSENQEIDPILYNYKDRNQKRNKQRNQKIRHVSANNSQDTVRRPLLRKFNMRNNLKQNKTKNMKDDEYLYQSEQGHSRLYHGQEEPLPIPMFTTHYFQGNNDQYIPKHDYTPSPVYLISSPNYRKHNLYPQCTRHRTPQYKLSCDNLHCTRGQNQFCQQSTGCETFTNPIVYFKRPSTLCLQTTKCPITCPSICPPLMTTMDNCNTDCSCSRDASQCCKHMPYMLRSGNRDTTKDFSSLIEDPEQYHDSNVNEKHQISHEKITTERLNEHNDMKHLKYNEQNRDYFYRFFDSNLRQKRQEESNADARPFWKSNIYYENPFDLKSLKYTTLHNRKTRTNLQTIIKPIITESITIKTDDYSIEENDKEINEEETMTEKYLSFDELMYLRKLSDNYMDFDPRRKNKAKTTNKKPKPTKGKTNKSNDNKKTPKSTTNTMPKSTKKKVTTKNVPPKAKAQSQPTIKKAPPTKSPTKTTTTKITINKKAEMKPLKLTATTPEYTANTPFERKKQCTRKLTCTWTVFTGLAPDGKPIQIMDVGSRTPPGYVEGCTRTSTCTRDFMERNKGNISSSDSDDDIAAGSAEIEDEDYCEKRSLKVHKRDYYQKNKTLSLTILKGFLNSRTNNLNSSKSLGCLCNKKIRIKRQEAVSPKEGIRLISYADLYYLVLNKMMKSSKAELCNANKCMCNSSSSSRIVSFRSFCFVLLIIL